MAQCRVHAEVMATRQCTGCDATWCDHCGTTVGPRKACPDCGHVLERCDAGEMSIDRALGDAARRLFTMEGLTTSAAIAVVYALAAYSWPLLLIYFSALASYYFVIVRHVGDGKDGMPGPTDTVDDWTETVSFAIRGVLCALVGFAPVILYLVYGSSVDHITVLGLLAIGQLYMPAAILAVAVSNSTFGAIWPVAWVQIISRAPDRYARFAFVWLGSVIAGFGLSLATAILLPPNIIGAYGAGLVWCLYWFGQAVLVGHFLQQNRSRFGWN
jgi:hypothetical protein